MDKKKKIISLISLIVFILILTGLSFAAYSGEIFGTRSGDMSVGSISLNFDNESVMNLNDASVVSDQVGSAMSEADAYTFDVVASITGDFEMNYDLALDSMIGEGLTEDDIKISLVKKTTVGGVLSSNYVLGTNNTGVLISSLSSSVSSNNYIDGYVIDSGYFNKSETVSYVLRAWIIESGNGLPSEQNITSSNDVCSDTTYTNESDCEASGAIWGNSHAKEQVFSRAFSFKVKLLSEQV